MLNLIHLVQEVDYNIQILVVKGGDPLMDDDKFHLNRADDGFKNLSNDNLEAIRILNGANKDTGFWDTDTGNLNDDIVNLARNIGLDDDVSGAYRFSDFAKEMTRSVGEYLKQFENE